jgi:hypothetical protein
MSILSGTAYFSDVTEDGAPRALWVSSILLGIPTLVYAVVFVAVATGRLQFTTHLRAWLHTHHQRYFISMVRAPGD